MSEHSLTCFVCFHYSNFTSLVHLASAPSFAVLIITYKRIHTYLCSRATCSATKSPCNCQKKSPKLVQSPKACKTAKSLETRAIAKSPRQSLKASAVAKSLSNRQKRVHSPKACAIKEKPEKSPKSCAFTKSLCYQRKAGAIAKSPWQSLKVCAVAANSREGTWPTVHPPPPIPRTQLDSKCSSKCAEYVTTCNFRQRINEKYDAEVLTEKQRTYFLHFFFTLEVYYTYLRGHYDCDIFQFCFFKIVQKAWFRHTFITDFSHYDQ